MEKINDKVILVEDGSIRDLVEEKLINSGYLVVRYRKGSPKPELLLKEQSNSKYKEMWKGLQSCISHNIAERKLIINTAVKNEEEPMKFHADFIRTLEEVEAIMKHIEAKANEL